MRKTLIAILFAAICPLLLAQQTLNNDSVIKMVKMGFQEDMIINAINRSPGTYDTSTDGLTALKNAGVKSNVVSAMVSKGTAPAAPSTPPQPTAPAALAAPPQTVPATAVPSTVRASAAQPAAPMNSPVPPANRPRVFLQSQSHGSLWNAYGINRWK
jgi:hypothetical protein